jgi:hypothetical protein
VRIWHVDKVRTCQFRVGARRVPAVVRPCVVYGIDVPQYTRNAPQHLQVGHVVKPGEETKGSWVARGRVISRKLQIARKRLETCSRRQSWVLLQPDTTTSVRTVGAFA